MAVTFPNVNWLRTVTGRWTDADADTAQLSMSTREMRRYGLEALAYARQLMNDPDLEVTYSWNTDLDELSADDVAERELRANAFDAWLNDMHPRYARDVRHWDAGRVLRLEHGPLFSVKSEEVCACLVGVYCGAHGYPTLGSLTEDGPHGHAASQFVKFGDDDDDALDGA